jgi:hypothetical protein
MADSLNPPKPERTQRNPHTEGASRAWRSPRHLNEPVLSSAQEELHANPEPQSASYSSATGSGVAGRSGQAAWWRRPQEQLTHYAREQPGRAALLALGAGALAALLLGRGSSSRRRKV